MGDYDPYGGGITDRSEAPRGGATWEDPYAPRPAAYERSGLVVTGGRSDAETDRHLLSGWLWKLYGEGPAAQWEKRW